MKRSKFSEEQIAYALLTATTRKRTISVASFQTADLFHRTLKENRACAAILFGLARPGKQLLSAPRRPRKWPRRPD